MLEERRDVARFGMLARAESQRDVLPAVDPQAADVILAAAGDSETAKGTCRRWACRLRRGRSLLLVLLRLTTVVPAASRQIR